MGSAPGKAMPATLESIDDYPMELLTHEERSTQDSGGITPTPAEATHGGGTCEAANPSRSVSACWWNPEEPPAAAPAPVADRRASASASLLPPLLPSASDGPQPLTPHAPPPTSARRGGDFANPLLARQRGEAPAESPSSDRPRRRPCAQRRSVRTQINTTKCTIGGGSHAVNPSDSDSTSTPTVTPGATLPEWLHLPHPPVAAPPSSHARTDAPAALPPCPTRCTTHTPQPSATAPSQRAAPAPL
ncbi:extracellular serine-threonine rich protein [Strigomonas culicis]|uniref:Extracellular serine-threonine rich protein n=1 Tax=Strigomonas culicis TaxID=28005 RepID=S9TPU5_9TRYP|nr:extracellular serine-threonine rich protein [Strigomonas culicis]|eukprot:EPY18493.1 extracellular serine-threonine rich protein [Strigomonas culicis]